MGPASHGGRIWGLLLVDDGPGLTSREIGERLSASAGSVSTMTRMLAQMNLVERVGVAGQREAIWRACDEVWTTFLGKSLASVGRLRALAVAAQSAVAPGGVADQRLRDMNDLYSEFEQLTRDILRRHGSVADGLSA